MKDRASQRIVFLVGHHLGEKSLVPCPRLLGDGSPWKLLSDRDLFKFGYAHASVNMALVTGLVNDIPLSHHALHFVQGVKI
jgi:hypothetical protein